MEMNLALGGLTGPNKGLQIDFEILEMISENVLRERFRRS